MTRISLQFISDDEQRLVGSVGAIRLPSGDRPTLDPDAIDVLRTMRVESMQKVRVRGGRFSPNLTVAEIDDDFFAWQQEQR